MPPSGGAGRHSSGCQPLSEEELTFCWRSLVDQGQLSVHRLQVFMQDVLGETITAVQAKDLLAYMDANGDGRVGMEDFRNFMSVGCLADTNPKDFMWTPKRRYREEHGIGHAAGFGSRDAERRASTATLAAETRTLHEPKAAVHHFEVKPPAERRRGFARASLVRASLAVPPVVPEHREEEELRQEQRAAQRRLPPPDAKALAKVEAAVERHERATWQRLLVEEEEAQRRLFEQFAAADPAELSAAEYHKMLLRWHRHARWCLPGDIRAGDSLAALQHLLAHAKEYRGSAAEDDAEPPPLETKLPFPLWLEVVRGLHAPEAAGEQPASSPV